MTNKTIPTTTRLVPDTRINKESFVSEKILPPWNVAVTQEVNIPTSALRVGVKVDLIRISQNDEVLRNGALLLTDCLGPHILLDRLYFTVTVGDDVDTFCIYLFEPFAQSSNPGTTLLNVDTIAPVYPADNRPRTVLTDLSGLTAAVKLTGSVNIDRSVCIVEDGGLSLYRVFDSEVLQSVVGRVDVVGYTLVASRNHH